MTLKTVCVQAKAERFQVAISNPCFEFWLFLHKFDAGDLPQRIHQLAQEKRPGEMKRILDEVNYNYHSLSDWEFRRQVIRAVQCAKGNEKGRKSSFPEFPGTDVYKVVESLPVKTIRD